MIGHPFDTIKTKMQVQQGFESSQLNAIRTLWSEAGIRGFYKGSMPALIGCVINRAGFFTSYEIAYSNLEYERMIKAIPCSGGI